MFDKKEKLQINTIAAKFLKLNILCGVLGDEYYVLISIDDLQNEKFDIFSNGKDCFDITKLLYEYGLNIHSVVAGDKTLYFFTWVDDKFNQISNGSMYLSFEDATGAGILHYWGCQAE